MGGQVRGWNRGGREQGGEEIGESSPVRGRISGIGTADILTNFLELILQCRSMWTCVSYLAS